MGAYLNGTTRDLNFYHSTREGGSIFIYSTYY